MSLNLEQVADQVHTLLDTDAALAPIPFLKQVADDVADQEAAKAYNQKLEEALRAPGVAFVAVVSDGVLAADPRMHVLDLDNAVLLAIVVNDAKNATELSAVQILRRVLRVCHRGQMHAKGARCDVRLDRNAYQLGPMGQGKLVYFVNLLVRSTEELGPVSS